MIKDFRHACIVVGDLERALGFYRDLMGLKVCKVLTVEGEYPEAVFNMKGVKLTYVKMESRDQCGQRAPVFELHYWERPRIAPQGGYNHISFTVCDIENEYKRLGKSGVRFISRPVRSPDNATKVCFGYDPDGNLIEFIEELTDQ